MNTRITDFTTVLEDATLRATLLLVATALVALLARHASAAQRHLIWSLGLGGVLCLVPLGFAFPRLLTLSVPALSRLTAQGTHSSPPLPTSPSTASVPPTIGPEGTAAPAPSIADTAPSYPVLPLCLVLGWLSGSLLVLARLGRGVLAVRHLARSSGPITDQPLAGAVRGARGVLPAGGRADFRQATAPGGAWVPMSWGLRPPVVILPAGAEHWPPGRVHAALLHEMAHVARRDWPVQMLAEIACALYWFHPLVWLAARQARAEAEHACDDLVLAAGVGPADYAGHLVGVASAARALRAAPVAAVGMVRPSALGRRLDAVLAPNVRRDGRTPRTLAVAVALTSACVLCLSALGPATADDSVGSASGALHGVTVIVDPGHGGQDTGGVVDGVTEKSLNFDIAQRLRAALEQRGATVFLTRDGDTFPALMARPRLAAQRHADYFVSLHCDDVPARVYGESGTVVYYHGDGPVGRRLAGSVSASIGHATGETSRLASDLTRFSPGGFGVLRGASMPAVLVECGDMTIPADLARMRDPQAQQRLVTGITAGLSAYQSHPKRVMSSDPTATDTATQQALAYKYRKAVLAEVLAERQRTVAQMRVQVLQQELMLALKQKAPPTSRH